MFHSLRAFVPLRLIGLIAGLFIAYAPSGQAQLPLELDSERRSIQGTIECSPEALRLPDGREWADRYPLARALELAAPGCVIRLRPGQYGQLGIGFDSRQDWNAKGAGGVAGNPVIVDGFNQAQLVPGGASDTIGVHGGVESGHIRFQNLQIEAGTRAGVLFYERPPEQAHRGYEFHDCTIDGKWDHATKSGPHDSKWGVLGHALADFVFAGVRGRAVVKNIRHEHAFYLQNPRGDLTIENVDGHQVGRTFLQITARESQGPAGRGLITVRGCEVADIGLSDWDNHKGGSAFTFAGRLPHCTIVVSGNTYRAGFNSKLTHLKPPGRSYGTGALVAWDGTEKIGNGALVLQDNDFEFAESCGDRPVVKIGACEIVRIGPGNRFVSGSSFPALDVDPTRPGSSELEYLPNAAVTLLAGNTFEGGVRRRGEELSDSDLAEWIAKAEQERAAQPDPTDKE